MAENIHGEVALTKFNDGSLLDKSDRYYIASGFFTDEQKNFVSKIENSASDLKMQMFSPRTESTPFFTEKDEEAKDMMTWTIFQNNVDRMRSANKYIVNLMNYDMGTVWELGFISSFYEQYIKGLYRDVKVLNDENDLFSAVAGVMKNHTEYLTYKKPINHSVTEKLMEKYPLLREAINKTEVAVLSIDDRPEYNIALAGIFYGREIPVITFSEKGFGSNVMLAQSCYHFSSVEELEASISSIKKLDDFEMYNRPRQDFNVDIK